MAINKVEANGQTLIDLTSDTATATDVIEGKTLHLASGAVATGTYRPSDEIEARLEATVGHSSKNLLDLTKYSASSNVTNIVINPETGSVSANASGAWKSIYFIDENIKFENGKTYVVSCTNNAVNALGSLAIRNRATNVIYKNVSFNTLGVKSITFTPNTTDFPNGWMISLFITSTSGADSNIDISDLMLREVSISDDTFEPYQIPTDEAKQDKPVVLYDAGESSVGVHSVTGFSNLTQYSELHITLFAPVSGNEPDTGYTHTIVYPFILSNNPANQAAAFDCWITAIENGSETQKRVGIGIQATNTTVEILGEIDEQDGGIDTIPSNHYIYIKRIVGIPK